jgi:hypothetical protein
VGNNDGAIQTRQDIRRNITEKRGISHSVVADPVNEHGAGIPTFRVEQGGILIFDSTILIHASNRKFDYTVSLAG